MNLDFPLREPTDREPPVTVEGKICSARTSNKNNKIYSIYSSRILVQYVYRAVRALNCRFTNSQTALGVSLYIPCAPVCIIINFLEPLNPTVVRVCITVKSVHIWIHIDSVKGERNSLTTNKVKQTVLYLETIQCCVIYLAMQMLLSNLLYKMKNSETRTRKEWEKKERENGQRQRLNGSHDLKKQTKKNKQWEYDEERKRHCIEYWIYIICNRRGPMKSNKQ